VEAAYHGPAEANNGRQAARPATKGSNERDESKAKSKAEMKDAKQPVNGMKQRNCGFATLIVALATLTLLPLGSRCLAAAPEIEMVNVRGGCFQMGDAFSGGNPDERPVHEVCLNDFYIGKYAVTQAEWQAVMGNNPSKFTGDRRPVESVSWNDAQAFIAKLNRMTGRRYRLPTEAEWEYAARSGGKNEKWAGTSDPSQLSNYAWYSENSGQKTHAVGTKKPNGLGLFDMSGNVSEWVQDLYGEVWYEESPKDNPQGPRTGNARVLRGGSWAAGAWNLRDALRLWYDPAFWDDFLGFRLAASSR
jgi:formylglycine-generating enzyme required for sulfatase activity